jgi:hypothetical protein
LKALPINAAHEETDTIFMNVLSQSWTISAHDHTLMLIEEIRAMAIDNDEENNRFVFVFVISTE